MSRYALVIGIGQYKYGSLPALSKPAGEGSRDTRQRRPRQDLVQMADGDLGVERVIESVLEKLGDQGRLLVFGEAVDLAHEALTEAWQRFGQWREQDRDLRKLVDRIEDAYKEWLHHQTDADFLLSRGILSQVNAYWSKLESQGLLNDKTRKYCLNSHENELSQKRAIQENEIQKHATKILNMASEINVKECLAATLEIVDQNIEISPSILLPCVRDCLSKTEGALQAYRTYPGHLLSSMDISDDGKIMIVGGSNHTIFLLDLEKNESNLILRPPFPKEYPVSLKPRHIYDHMKGFVTSVVFSKERSMVISSSWDDLLMFWDLQGELVKVKHYEKLPITSMKHNHSKDFLIIERLGGVLDLVDNDGSPIRDPIRISDDYVWRLASSPVEDLVAIGDTPRPLPRGEKQPRSRTDFMSRMISLEISKPSSELPRSSYSPLGRG